MKKIFFLLLLSVVNLDVSAKIVPEWKIERVAHNYYSRLAGNVSLVDVTPKSFIDVMRVFAPENGIGFVITTCDDAVWPIVGYSVNSHFTVENMPGNVQAWFDDIRKMIEWTRDSVPDKHAAEEWNLLAGDSGRKDTIDTTGIVGPLLTTCWNQAPYYNSLCPLIADDSSRALVGCAAVAMGQIMKYWNYPPFGRGSVSYELEDYGTITECLDSSFYEWESMPDSLNAYSDSSEVFAVAKLLYDIGVALNMKYSATASGAMAQSYGHLDYPCVENAFPYAFKYSSSIHALNYETYNFDNYRWSEMLKTEIMQGRPVFYSASAPFLGGHGFVVDGYDSLSYSQGTFHANFGWGGKNDGFFAANLFRPNGNEFLLYQTMLIGIIPVLSVCDTVSIIAIPADSSMGYVTGEGIYATNIDTVKLMATAYEGYRFVRWNDGCMYNPRVFIANEDCSYTALFSSVDDEANRLTYVSDYSYMGCHSTDTAFQWGVMYPDAALHGSKYLDDVFLANMKECNYTVIVYQGGTHEPEDEVYRETINVGVRLDVTRFNSCQLSKPVAIDTTKSLWITLMSDSSVAYGTFFCGNRDAMMVKGTDGWYSLNDSNSFYSWSIRAGLSSSPSRRVSASLDISEAGTVNDLSYYYRYFPIGSTCTLRVDCQGTDSATGRPYVFLNWSDGSTENPYVFTVEGTTTLVAHIGLGQEESVSEADDGKVLVYVNGDVIHASCTDYDAEISVYDILGRMIQSSKSMTMECKVPQRGVYLVRIVGKDGIITRKVAF